MSEEDGREPGLPGIFVTGFHLGHGSVTLLWDIPPRPGRRRYVASSTPGRRRYVTLHRPYPGVPRLSTA
jgi:hypothetical protein